MWLLTFYFSQWQSAHHVQLSAFCLLISFVFPPALAAERDQATCLWPTYSVSVSCHQALCLTSVCRLVPVIVTLAVQHLRWELTRPSGASCPMRPAVNWLGQVVTTRSVDPRPLRGAALVPQQMFLLVWLIPTSGLQMVTLEFCCHC